MSKIDWNEMLSGAFVQLEGGVPKKLLLKNWKPQENFKDENNVLKKGLIFEVWKEDNGTFDAKTKKSWTVTSARALKKLRPIIEKAEAQGKDSIAVNVVKAGENTKTVYEISECAF